LAESGRRVPLELIGAAAKKDRRYADSEPTGSGDPVASHLRPVGRASHVVEDAARPLDDGGRPGVFVVARHEDPVDSLGARHDQCLPEYLGGVAATAVTRPDAISDVAAEVREECIQLVTYRDAADEIGARVRDKEGRRDSIRRYLEPTAALLEPVEVHGPGLIGSPVQEEVESVESEFFVGGDCAPFVSETQRP
jgi:hypothetical protein